MAYPFDERPRAMWDDVNGAGGSSYAIHREVPYAARSDAPGRGGFRDVYPEAVPWLIRLSTTPTGLAQIQAITGNRNNPLDVSTMTLRHSAPGHAGWTKPLDLSVGGGARSTMDIEEKLRRGYGPAEVIGLFGHEFEHAIRYFEANLPLPWPESEALRVGSTIAEECLLSPECVP